MFLLFHLVMDYSRKGKNYENTMFQKQIRECSEMRLIDKSIELSVPRSSPLMLCFSFLRLHGLLGTDCDHKLS